DLAARPEPEGLAGVELLLLRDLLAVLLGLDVRDDRMSDEIGVFLHQFAELPRFEKVAIFLLEMEDDVRAAFLLGVRRNLELALAVRFPFDAVFLRSGHAAADGDLVGDHERRIEADTELPDQLGSLPGVGGLERLEKLARAGAGD